MYKIKFIVITANIKAYLQPIKLSKDLCHVSSKEECYLFSIRKSIKNVSNVCHNVNLYFLKHLECHDVHFKRITYRIQFVVIVIDIIFHASLYLIFVKIIIVRNVYFLILSTEFV